MDTASANNRLEVVLLSGDTLNVAVVDALGMERVDMGVGFSKSWVRCWLDDGAHYEMGFCPSSHWSDGGPLIERYSVATAFTGGAWEARYAGDSGRSVATGPSPLVAAMRAIVIAHCGEFIDQSTAANPWNGPCHCKTPNV